MLHIDIIGKGFKQLDPSGCAFVEMGKPPAPRLPSGNRLQKISEHLLHNNILVLALQPGLEQATQDDVKLAIRFLSNHLSAMRGIGGRRPKYADCSEAKTCLVAIRAGDVAEKHEACLSDMAVSQAEADAQEHARKDLSPIGDDKCRAKSDQRGRGAFQCSPNTTQSSFRAVGETMVSPRPSSSDAQGAPRSAPGSRGRPPFANGAGSRPATWSSAGSLRSSEAGSSSVERRHRRLSHVAADLKESIIANNEKREQQRRWKQLQEKHEQQVKDVKGLQRMLQEPKAEHSEELLTLLAPLRDIKRRMTHNISNENDLRKLVENIRAPSPSLSSSNSAASVYADEVDSACRS